MEGYHCTKWRNPQYVIRTGRRRKQPIWLDTNKEFSRRELNGAHQEFERYEEKVQPTS